MTETLYDRIGRTYTRHRRADARIASRVHAALGSCVRVVNVGAGSGSYEPGDRYVVAVEPSVQMIRQRPPSAAPAVRAIAEALPLADATFDAALAVLTVHHWTDWRRGMAELRRVARSTIVVLTWDPESKGFWLVQDYFPEIPADDRERFPSISDLAAELGNADVHPILVPDDCQDGFLGAYWKRPHAYLDPDVRSGMSAFAAVDESDPRLAALANELQNGEWEQRNRELLQLSELDIGYRLIVAHPGRRAG